MKKKWFWGAAIALLLTILLATVAFAVAGDADDPLVALSYLTGAYKRSLLDEAQTQIGDQISDAETRIARQLDALDAPSAQWPSSSGTGYWRASFSAGETIDYETGAEILFLSGGATVESGSLSDSTAGVVLGVSAGVSVNHLHIAVTSGTLRVTDACEVLIRE